MKKLPEGAEIESLNQGTFNLEELTPEQLEQVLAGADCDIFRGPCGTFTGSCGQFGPKPVGGGGVS